MLRRMMMAAASAAPPSDALPTAILADAPWAYYRLNDLEGPALDSSGHDRHLSVVTGTPDFGRPGMYAGADAAMRTVRTTAQNGERVGSGNNTYGTDIAAAFNGNKSWTLAAVIRVAAWGGVLIHIGNYQLGGSQGLWLSVGANGELGVGAFTSESWKSVTSAPDTLELDVPALVHVTRGTGNEARVYKNGTLVATGSIPQVAANPGTASGGMRISVGSASSGEDTADATSATLQDATIYDKALTPARILAQAQAAGFA